MPQTLDQYWSTLASSNINFPAVVSPGAQVLGCLNIFVFRVTHENLFVLRVSWKGEKNKKAHHPTGKELVPHKL